MRNFWQKLKRVKLNDIYKCVSEMSVDLSSDPVRVCPCGYYYRGVDVYWYLAIVCSAVGRISSGNGYYEPFCRFWSVSFQYILLFTSNSIPITACRIWYRDFSRNHADTRMEKISKKMS